MCLRLSETCIKLALTSAYHRQLDDQATIVNKEIETYLRCYVGSKPRTWATWLSMVDWSYDIIFHSSTTVSHFEALYGFPPPNYSLMSLALQLICLWTSS